MDKNFKKVKTLERSIRNAYLDRDCATIFRQYHPEYASEEIETIMEKFKNHEIDFCSGVSHFITNFFKYELKRKVFDDFNFSNDFEIKSIDELISVFPKDNLLEKELHMLYLSVKSGHNVSVLKKGNYWALYQGWADKFHLFPEINRRKEHYMRNNDLDIGFTKFKKKDESWEKRLLHNEYHHNLWFDNSEEQKGSIEIMLFKAPYLTTYEKDQFVQILTGWDMYQSTFDLEEAKKRLQKLRDLKEAIKK